MDRWAVPARFGLFYVNAADPMKGGTGHTIRVCRRQGVPVAFQEDWMGWFPEKTCSTRDASPQGCRASTIGAGSGRE